MSKKHKTMAAASGGSIQEAEWETEFPSPASLNEEEIAQRAYSYWEQRGYEQGSAEDDWYRAIEELHQEQKLKDR